ncbi:MAG TPA: cobalamin-binding protein [Firmicutes bacterium]|nr:cobalamin-binding protein [Bacillota bacterium]
MKYKQLAQTIEQLEAESALELVQQLVAGGESPAEILAASRAGMEGVGKRFEGGEYFVADLMLSANLFQEIMQILEPVLSADTRLMESKGKVVIATVKEDIHDIGKNLVIAMLSANGFEVVDLGVNVDPDVICQAIIREQPHILALSCLLTSTLDGIEDTIAELEKQGLRDKVKVIVGGAPVTAKLAQQFGADAYGADAYDAVPQCLALMEGR